MSRTRCSSSVLHKHAHHYRDRLVRMRMESLRGVVRGGVTRFRNTIYGSPKRMLYRRIQRQLAFYQSRFGQDAFVKDVKLKLIAPLPRSNWLPGGYAFWRRRYRASLLSNVLNYQCGVYLTRKISSGECDVIVSGIFLEGARREGWIVMVSIACVFKNVPEAITSR